MLIRLLRKHSFVNNSNFSPDLIPSIHVSPVKFLGRIISESLFDATEVRSFCEAVFSSLVAIDKCQLRGVQSTYNILPCPSNLFRCKGQILCDRVEEIIESDFR